MMMGTKWSHKYPPGSMRSRDELQDIIIEARKGKKAIRIYLVEQMGHLKEVFITSKSKLLKPTDTLPGDSFYKCHVMVKSSFAGDRYYPSDILCGSYSIGTMSSEHHRAFLNKRSAVQYADELKNDPAYVQSVKDHWAKCERLFGSLGGF